MKDTRMVEIEFEDGYKEQEMWSTFSIGWKKRDAAALKRIVSGETVAMSILGWDIMMVRMIDADE